MDPTVKGRVISMSKALPTTEEERTAEARELAAMIPKELYPKLTTWEMQTVSDIKDGKASTKFRLTELRQIVKRLQEDAS